MGNAGGGGAAGGPGVGALSSDSQDDISRDIKKVDSNVIDPLIMAVYDLGYCYLQNREYLRCVELIEK